ncbi:alpha/beta hydrolase [Hyphococcus sp.]|uniref:alpha/beta hydrolase n=1 Tax=Hyphococcus sp. TaxID=2038636 RepID=UPI003CCBC7EA
MPKTGHFILTSWLSWGLICALFVALPFHSNASQSGIENCEDVTLAATTGVPILQSYSLYGKLCHPDDGPSDTVQILVHGYTYDHRYWSLPDFGEAYDYVKSANEAGFSTLAIDRIGSAGESSRPLSALVTLQTGANALHDVVSAARSGALPGGPYENVVTVGHSLGAAIAWIEASVYDDVDGIISTGFGHPAGAVQDILINTAPAVLDSRLRPLVGLDIGYLTTAPGSRDSVFYNAETREEGIIDYDETTKGLGTASEIATLSTAELATLNISVPVLFVIGQYDNLFCLGESIGGFVNCQNAQTVFASEKAYFPLVADFETYVLYGAGHNINLHQGAENWFGKAADWMAQRFGAAH